MLFRSNTACTDNKNSTHFVNCELNIKNIRIVSLANIRDYFQIIIRRYSFLFETLQGATLEFQCFAIIEPVLKTVILFQYYFYRVADRQPAFIRTHAYFEVAPRNDLPTFLGNARIFFMYIFKPEKVFNIIVVSGD